MRILDIVEDTMVDGPGFRTAIYCAGCAHHCPGCHNPQSWDFAAGRDMSPDDILAVVLADPYANVTLTGGDPMYQAADFAELARACRAAGKTVWCFTGFLYEELLTRPDCLALLRELDVLVDGPYVAAQRDADLLFRGSANQRLIDVPASLAAGEVQLWQADVQP